MVEKIQMWIAWKLPRWLVRWASVRMIAHATTGRYSTTVVPEISAMDALQRWEEAGASSDD
jgi:hypothetical protein